MVLDLPLCHGPLLHLGLRLADGRGGGRVGRGSNGRHEGYVMALAM
jgi:hypothetical protein